tara:strand:- start:30 stop:176 length:147 start_codon:yes stop_codon:yes gene_type:complete
MDEKGVFPKLLVKFNLGVFSVGQGATNIPFAQETKTFQKYKFHSQTLY